MSFTAKWGPWIGVPKDKQTICAVVDCIASGKPFPCFYDGTQHHHGCIHYDKKELTKAGMSVREGWGWLCEHHHSEAWRLFREKVQAREAAKEQTT